MSVILADAPLSAVMGYSAPLVYPYTRTTAKGKLVEATKKILVNAVYNGRVPYSEVLYDVPAAVHSLEINYRDITEPVPETDTVVYVTVPYTEYSSLDKSMLGKNVRIIVDLEGCEFSLRRLVGLCEGDERVSFIGAFMLVVPGLRVGYLADDEIPGVKSKKPVVVGPTFGFDAVEHVSLMGLGGVTQSKTAVKVPRKKRSKARSTTKVLGIESTSNEVKPKTAPTRATKPQKAKPVGLGTLFGTGNGVGF